MNERMWKARLREPMTFLLPLGSREDLGLTTRGSTFGGLLDEAFMSEEAQGVM